MLRNITHLITRGKQSTGAINVPTKTFTKFAHFYLERTERHQKTVYFWHFSDQSRQNLNFFFGWGYFSVNSSDLLYFFTWAIITVKNLCLDAYKEKKPFLLRKVNTWSMAWFKEFVNIQTKLAYFLFLSGNFGIFSKVVCKMVLFSVCGKSKNLP